MWAKAKHFQDRLGRHGVNVVMDAMLPVLDNKLEAERARKRDVQRRVP